MSLTVVENIKNSFGVKYGDLEIYLGKGDYSKFKLRYKTENANLIFELYAGGYSDCRRFEYNHWMGTVCHFNYIKTPRNLDPLPAFAYFYNKLHLIYESEEAVIETIKAYLAAEEKKSRGCWDLP